MKKLFPGLAALLVLVFSGCSSIGDKEGSLSVIYGVTAVLALLVLVAYCFIRQKKNGWYLLLFGSVLVVNVGYFALAVSADLQQALMANRLAYLGSAFLPLAMWMIILEVSNIRIRRWLIWLLTGISLLMFLVAASPGVLDIYYKEVTFEKVNGVAVLNKVYGPLHGSYLFYLLGYFSAMVSTIVYGILKDKVASVGYAAILAVAVFVNIGLWLIEQLVRIDFEILSVSYIISELFLLGLNLMMVEQQRLAAAQQPAPVEPAPAEDRPDAATVAVYTAGVRQLTPTERLIYEAYLDGQTTKEVMARLNIKENTLKFHNKNIYSKLGVSSRKQLVAMSKFSQ